MDKSHDPDRGDYERYNDYDGTGSSESPGSSTFSPRYRQSYRYDVFVSFRKEHTVSSFVSHLCAALDRSGIVSFNDDQRRDGGESPSSDPQLVSKAIEDSKVALVIFSPNYATATWCVDELVKILQCRRDMGQLVLPIFYNIPASVVRNIYMQNKDNGKYLKAFTEHEEIYMEEESNVKKWTAALTSLANLSGFVLQDGMDEANVIKSIISATAKHVSYKGSNVDKGFLGTDHLVNGFLHNHIKYESFQPSSSSLPHKSHKYDVFLSFRGEDTRSNFVSHLHAALERKGIVTFKDDIRLERGRSISPELLKAIEDSKVALVILSRNYGSSTWCLNELLKIMQCREDMAQVVMPVFYQLQPSVIRKNFLRQKNEGKFLQASTERELEGKESKVQEWSDALTNLTNLSGFVVEDGIDEANAIRHIVRTTEKHMSYTCSNVDKGFVGMDRRVEDLVHNHICPWFNGVRIIGIHGMRGIGKTTLARAVYDRICEDFDGRCFLSNVREFSKKDGLVSLQEKLLSRILMEKTGNVEDEYNGADMIQKRLCRIRVLLVLDDVDQLTQLEKLAGHPNWFGPGSRIIITSTDIHLLNVHAVDTVYQATVLDPNEALQLLSSKAFKKSHPPENSLELCNHILAYAHGLPLALLVIGCSLFGRSTKEWESAIDMLKKKPERSIIDVLQISFDGLKDIEKEIFLHIACFYKGKDRNRVTEILDYCQLHPDINLSVLVEKSLITLSNNRLCMHDLLQEMGWEIVHRESPEEPGQRSRLWSHEDIHNVLKKSEGTEAIQGMVMDLPELEMANWHPEAFSNLSQLTILHIRNVNLPKGLTCLPNSLRLLEWRGYPLRALPQNFEPDGLIELNLCHSNLDQLWKGIKRLDKLKFIKLCHSHNIVKTPDFTGVQNLETLDLEGCKNLTQIHQSLGFLKRLVVLNLKDCERLESLPGKIESQSLETFILSGCSKVKQIPEFVENMKHLWMLCLDKTAIKELPASIEHISGLASLDLSNCKNLVSLPSTINGLKSLKKLNLSGCLKLGEQHGSGTAVTELHYLKDLIKAGCEVVWEYFSWSLPSGSMQRVNAVPLDMQLPLSGLCNLIDLNLSNCNLGDIAFAKNFGCFPSLLALNLSGNNFTKLPPGIQSCLKLEKINLENCKSLQELSGLPSNSVLDVRAEGCSSLEMLLDASIFNGLKISYFNFINCFKLNEGGNHMAFKMFKLFLYQAFSNAKQTFQIVIPGSEIPTWFSHQSIGVSLRVNIHGPLDGPIGFAICVVFVLHEHHRVDELTIHQFKTFKATHHLVCCLKVGGRTLGVRGRQPAFRFSEEFCQVESDHLWLFYVPSNIYFGYTDMKNVPWKSKYKMQWYPIEFLFETRGPGLKVKKCGIRLVYEDNRR